MIDLNKKSARTYSMLGQRGSIFGVAALETAREDSKFILLTADLATLSGMERFIKIYPEQYINVGIAEQNMLGIAAGLSAEGYHPVVTTYATFITMRSCEQIRHYLGYMGQKVVVVGSGAGLVQGFSGNTHYTIEDIAIMRSIPNIQIYSPADAGSAIKLFGLAMEQEQSVYIRLTGGLNCPIVYSENMKCECGGANVITEGNDVIIFATGTMVSSAIVAAKMLEEKGVSTKVVDMYSIKPINKDAILSSKSSKLIVTLEEHNIIGGLGAAVAEIISEESAMPPLLRLGIDDIFNIAGDYNNLLSQNRLLPEQICASVNNKLNQL